MKIWNKKVDLFCLFHIVLEFFSAVSALIESSKSSGEPECPAGYKLFGNYCYRFYSNSTLTWGEAENFCQNQAESGHLLWITGEQENDFIKELTKTNSSFLWLGGRRYCPNQNFRWPNSEEIGPYANWDPKAPPSLQGTDACLQMKLKDKFSYGNLNDTDSQIGLWSATDCGYKYGAPYYGDYKERYPLCKVPKKGFLQPPFSADKNGECELGWCNYGNKCFKLVENQTVWQNARQVCRNTYQSELASVHSAEEYKMLFEMGNAAGILGFGVWLGGNKLTNQENKFEWTDNSPFDYTAWGPQQPDHNNLYNTESCVQFFNNQSKNYVAQNMRGFWNDQRCDQRMRSFICMRGLPGHVDPPPPVIPSRGGCIKGWDKHGDRCFKLMEREMNFFAAVDLCQKTGDVIHSDLVSIHSAQQQETGNNQVWIGGFLNKSRYAGLDWCWTDETLFGDFINWKKEDEDADKASRKKRDTYRYGYMRRYERFGSTTVQPPNANKELKDGCAMLEGNKNLAKWVKVDAKQCESMKLKFICAQINDPNIPPENEATIEEPQKFSQLEQGLNLHLKEVEYELPVEEDTIGWNLFKSPSVYLSVICFMSVIILIVLVALLVKKQIISPTGHVSSGSGFRKLVEPDSGCVNPASETLMA